jgi:hypothetical protein
MVSSGEWPRETIKKGRQGVSDPADPVTSLNERLAMVILFDATTFVNATTNFGLGILPAPTDHASRPVR